MAAPTLDQILASWDLVAPRWRFMCHRHAAQRLVDGQPERRVARPHQTLRMPQEDAHVVVKGVRAELDLRAGL